MEFATVHSWRRLSVMLQIELNYVHVHEFHGLLGVLMSIIKKRVYDSVQRHDEDVNLPVADDHHRPRINRPSYRFECTGSHLRQPDDSVSSLLIIVTAFFRPSLLPGTDTVGAGTPRGAPVHSKKGNKICLKNTVYQAKLTMTTNTAAIKRLEALFQDVKLDHKKQKEVLVEVETKHSTKCDVHKNIARRGSLGSTLHLTNRRDSLGNVVSQKRDWYHPGYFSGVGPRRESMPALNNSNLYKRRDSLGLPANPPKKELEHPSQFNSTLRKGLSGSLSNNSRWGDKRNSFGGSMSNLNGKNYLQIPGLNMRRNSRNYSTDSLDGKRNSWDPGRRGSSGSSGGWDEPIYETDKVPTNSSWWWSKIYLLPIKTYLLFVWCYTYDYRKPPFTLASGPFRV
ncbi:hypothetical protein GWI33_007638 [Rhynchophorus ferrugineus]|uniref:Uncharacterized protein n=1 Tax=Rhynchophorus ferrugineus TaxID=354439 RepID=A0A834MCV4_RHYFE|nr:hypothetical protein GWI33_007638 [Rhynchophorus ferrugineus]